MKKAQKIILAVIILLALVLSVVAYAYFATDVFKSPSELFATAFMENINGLKEFNYKPFDEIIDKMINGKLETVIYIGEGSANKEDEKDASSDTENSSDSTGSKENGEETTTTEEVMETTNSTNIDQNTSDAEENIEDSQALSGTIAYVSDATAKAQKLNTNIKMGNEELLDLNFVIDTQKTMGLKVKGLYDKYIAVENRELKKLAKNIGIDEATINSIPDQILSEKDYSDEATQKTKDLFKRHFIESYNKINPKAFSVEKKVNISINDQQIECNKYILTYSSKELMNLFLVQTGEDILNDSETIALFNTEEDKSQLEELRIKLNDLRDKINELEDMELKISVYVSDKKTVQTELEIVDLGNQFFRIENENKMVCESKDIDGKTSIVSIENQFDGKSGKITFTKGKQKTTLNVSKADDKITIKSKLKDISTKMVFNLNSNVKIDELTEENTEVINDYTQEEFTNLLMKIQENIEKEAQENPLSLIGIIGSMSTGGDISTLTTLFSQSNDETVGSEMDEINNELSASSSLSLTTTNNTATVKKEIADKVTKGLKDSISEYKKAKEDDDNANLDNYLTVENVQKACDGYCKIELTEGVTLKVTVEDSDDIYYALMNINFDNLTVSQTTVYTESEYNN